MRALMTIGFLFTCTLNLGDSASAAILLFEDFSYADGSLTGQGTATDGWSGSWSSSGATVSSGRATFATGTAPTRTFTTVPAPADGNSYYYAYDITVEDVSPPGDIANVLLRAGVPGSFWSTGIFFNQFDINGLDGPTGSLIANQTYRIVSRGTRHNASSQTIVMWVDPVSEGDAHLMSLTDSDLHGLAFPSIELQLSVNAKLNSGNIFIDNFALATTFEEALNPTSSAVPEPSTFVLFMVGGACLLLFRKRQMSCAE